MIDTFKQPSHRQAGTFLSFVRPEFRRGYKIPGMDVQTNGIMSLTLWTTRQSVLRIIPGYDEETGEVFPQNINVNEYATDGKFAEYLSDSFVMTSIIDGFGGRNQSFITAYAPGSIDEQKYGGDTVINAFARAVNTSVLNASQGKKTKFGVTEEMKQWASMNGPLRYPKQALLMQALVFKRNGQDITDADGNPLVAEDGSALPQLSVVAVVGKATINALLAALVEPANPGLPLNPATNNKYGALAEMEGNVLYMNPVQDPSTKHNMLRPSVQEPGKGWTPTPYDLTLEEVHDLWVPWNKLLHYMTAEEQCKLIAQDFGADSVNYFIGTDPLFHDLDIPDDIKMAGYGRYAKFVGNKGGAAPVKKSAPIAERPQQARTQLGLPKAAAQAMQQAHRTYTPKGEEKTPEPGPGLTNLRANSAIDINKVRSTLSGIRQATAGNQATAAQNLLNDMDLDDYQEPGIDEVD